MTTKTMSKTLSRLALSALFATSTLFIAGCEDDPVDDALDDVEDAGDEVGDTIEDVADDVDG